MPDHRQPSPNTKYALARRTGHHVPWAAAIGEQAGAAQVVSMQVEQAVIRGVAGDAGGDGLPPQPLLSAISCRKIPGIGENISRSLLKLKDDFVDANLEMCLPAKCPRTYPLCQTIGGSLNYIF